MEGMYPSLPMHIFCNDIGRYLSGYISIYSLMRKYLAEKMSSNNNENASKINNKIEIPSLLQITMEKCQLTLIFSYHNLF